MTKFVPYAVFGITYLVAGLAIIALLDATAESELGALQHLAGPLAAPFALLIAKRVGVLSLIGVFVTSLVVGLGAYVVTFGILHSIGASAANPAPFLTLVKLGGWSFVFGNALLVLSPVVWLHVIHLIRRSMLAPGSAA
jgi:hypothetical protein